MYKFSQPELEELERALNAGEDVEMPEPKRPYWTRLHRAVEMGDLPRVKLLLRFGANVNAQDTAGRGPMHRVALSDYVEFDNEETLVEMIKLLLAAGADLNARDTDGDTPLSLAYHSVYPCCIRAFIDAGADPTISGKDRDPTPTFVVDLIRNSNGAEVVAKALAAGVDVNEDNCGETLLDHAALSSSPSAVRALLEAGANIPRFPTRLLLSAGVLVKSDGGGEVVVALIKAGADVNAWSEYDETPLHYAARYHSLVAIRLLLNSGADPNLSNQYGQTPLCDAVEYARDDDDHDIIKALLQGGATVNGPEDALIRPLQMASRKRHASTVRLLLEAGADPHLRDMQEGTALHTYAVTPGQDCTATVSALLEAGADPNAVDDDGDTPLHLALICHRSPSVIQLLLDRGADPRIRGPNGCTALHYALKDQNCTTTVLSALLGAGADPNARDDDGLMSLHYAVQWRSPFVTQLLVELGADPHARDNSGRTPLLCTTLAAERDIHWLEHAVALRDAGANIDDPDDEGAAPLYHALSRHAAGTACSLLWLGADPYAGDTGFLISPRVVIDLIGKANAHAILAIVTRAHLQSDNINSGRDRFIPPRVSAESDKEVCKVLICALRKQMLEQPPLEREGSIEYLSILYAMLGYYPSDPALHECEVALPPGRPSYFGGFADCWKGSFLGHHAIAMKTFRGSLAEEVGTRRLSREAKIWSQLSHPNVLPFLGLCTLGSVPYLISPWMENGHALDFVQKYPDVDCLRLLAQVADGLEYLHNFKPKPVIHGDLRGPNILISPSGDARIADFGLSELKTDTYETNYSTPFITAGHPRWQAPETIRAETKEEARRNTTTDIFAFGRVMLELFTGKVPFFYLAHEAMVIARILNEEYPRRPDDEQVLARGLDDSMWQLMMNCWDVTPSERPSAADLVARLTAALKSRSAGESSSNEESPISVEPATTPVASTDASVEGPAAHHFTCLEETESPPSRGELSSKGPTKRHTHQTRLYLALGFCVFGLAAIRLNRYLL